MKKLSLILFVLLVSAVTMVAQRTVTGKVADSNGDPLIGANVMVQGTEIGTVTDIDGMFSLEVPNANNALVVSYVGFQDQVIDVSTTANVNVTLAEGQLLEEVVVSALGINRNQKSVGYGVANVETKNLTQRSEPDMLRSLQGRVAGVDIRTSQGAPGSATRIQIRGNSSFGLETQPLIIVDGVPYSNDQVTTSSQTSGGAAYGSGISGIDPNEIETFQVLKGAAAAAIYGSRGSRGVVLITTKSGSLKKKEGFNVSLSSSYGVENISNLPTYQNSYGTGTNFNYANANGSWGPKFGTLDSIPAWPEYYAAYPELFSSTGKTPYKAYPNNVKELFRTGNLNENSINISGGSGYTGFNITASLLNHNGYIENSNYKRYNVGMGGNTRVWNKVTIGGNFSYMKGDQKGGYFGENQVAGASSQFARSLFLGRNWDLSLPFEDNAGKPLIPNGGSQFDNPHWAALHNVANTTDERIVATGVMSYEISKYLTATYRLGTNLYTLERNEITDIFSRAAGGLGRLVEDRYRKQEIESTLTLSFNNYRISDNLDLSVNLGHNMNQRFQNRNANTGLDFVVPNIYTLKNTSSQVFDVDQAFRQRLIGVFFDATVGFKNYAYLNLAGRNDWSSTLPKENRSYFYPAISGSLILSEMFNTGSVSFAKLRAGYAKVGNDAPPYKTQDVYIIGSLFKGLSRIDRSITTTDPNLSPEFTTELELGADLRIFKDRIGIGFTWYDKNTTDLIYDISIPQSTGYDNFTTNVGRINNTGIELDVNAIVLQNKNLSWSVGAALTKNKNVVEELVDGLERVQLTGVLTELGPYLEKGLPYGYLRGTKVLRDEAGNLLINPATGGMIVANDQDIIGDPNPDYKLGINTQLSYKNFFVNGLFDMTKGGDIYSVTLSSMLGRGVTADTEDREGGFVIPGVYADPANLQSGQPLLVDGQPVKNTTALTMNDLYFSPNATTGATFAINTATEWNVYDATVYRLRDLSLGYNLDANFLGFKGIKGGTISVSGRNLWHYAPNVPKHTNFDPEVNSFGATTTQGIELSAAPNSRRFSVNLKLNF